MFSPKDRVVCKQGEHWEPGNIVLVSHPMKRDDQHEPIAFFPSPGMESTALIVLDDGQEVAVSLENLRHLR